MTGGGRLAHREGSLDATERARGRPSSVVGAKWRHGRCSQALDACERCGGWRCIDAEAAIQTFVEFYASEIPEGHIVLRRVGGNALVFVGEQAAEPYVAAYGYDEWGVFL